ncbi:hypothetical protein ACHAXA_008809 [Cyclostephanos tholiformis]|uniref:Uncharacterized protein n=1 Tax=Cyclostephanos tholiformis TaxID=382380 RepID=A0ABD3RSV9_9STRA
MKKITPAATITTIDGGASRHLNLMTSAEIESIINEAESCADGECALDEVSSLISTLQTQQSMLSKRVNEIDGLIKALENANGRGGDDRPVDEMKDRPGHLSLFAMGVVVAFPRPPFFPFLRRCLLCAPRAAQFPKLTAPMGYTGETKGGGKTAYDVLPPKPIKK